MAMMKSKLKWAALGGLVLSFVSLMVHLFLAKSSADLVRYTAIAAFSDDDDFSYLNTAAPKICDLVTIARLLNATLVVPEIQESSHSKGISSKFKSFSYLYDEDHFITALSNDVIVVKNLPPHLKEIRKRKQHPIFEPKISTSPSFYLTEVLPKLKNSKIIGLVLSDGGCLQPMLPPSLAEYQRLRCRTAFFALHFRPEIVALGHRMVERLRASGQPYLAYHPGLKRDTLAYHGCAELFQDVHTELIQFRRAEMIKQGIINEELSVDSHAQKQNASCPLMPEEVGLLLRAMGYPPRTRIYLAGSELFGGQRVVIPLRALYINLVDRTSLCSKQELVNLTGPETPLPMDLIPPQPDKIVKQVKEDWDKAGPPPRPLPPPPDRPIYRHEKEGWHGWVAERNSEPDPSPIDLREQAHRLLWDALDYVVSFEADAFFPGFDDDGSWWPDFSSLVMGHRLYEMASARTYRPNRKYLAELLNSTIDHLYYPSRNWTVSINEHLNKSLSIEGLLREFHLKKHKSFLSHPIPECSCTTSKKAEIIHSGKDSDLHLLSEGQDECPEMITKDLTVQLQHSSANEMESQEAEVDMEGKLESESKSKIDALSSPRDEEMDPDD